MFEEFFGFSRTPFSRDIPTDDLFFSDQLQETLGRLTYAAERQLFALVTGECGTGKTTTIRRFKESLDEHGFKVLYISDSKLTPRHFYKGLLEQLGIQAKFYRGDAKRQLHREVELLRGLHHLKPVVIVDEGFAARLHRSLEQAIGQRATAVLPEAWARRPLVERLLSWMAYGTARFALGVARARWGQFL